MAQKASGSTLPKINTHNTLNTHIHSLSLSAMNYDAESIKGFLNLTFLYHMVSLAGYYGLGEVDTEAVSHPMVRD